MDKSLDSRQDAAHESDDEDEMPDYRVLSAMTKRHKAGTDATPTIPKRGEKDFEPTGFGGQSKLLEQSRAALFGAIALDRTHSSRSLSTATWDPVFKRAFLHVSRGQSCAHCGVSERRVIDGQRQPATLELLPEETVYLVERGALDCRWTIAPGTVPRAEDHARGIPLSVAQAYALVLGQDGSTPERYQIYAYLKRLGYIVQRASVTDAVRQVTKPRARASEGVARVLRALLIYMMRPFVWLIRVFRGFMRRKFMAPRGLLGISARDTHGALLLTDDIFKTLRIVKSTHTNPPAAESIPTLEPFYYAWRPATHFKRTAPPPPEFRICIVDTTKQPLFNLREFSALFATIPLEEQDDEVLAEVRERNRRSYGKQPKQKREPAQRDQPAGVVKRCMTSAIKLLRHIVALFLSTCMRQRRSPGNVFPALKAGRRNVVVAIIEQGTASLLRFGKAEFERLRLVG